MINSIEKCKLIQLFNFVGALVKKNRISIIFKNKNVRRYQANNKSKQTFDLNLSEER